MISTIVIEPQSRLANILARKCPELHLVGKSNDPQKSIGLIELMKPHVVVLDLQSMGGFAEKILREFSLLRIPVVVVGDMLESGLSPQEYPRIRFLQRSLVARKLRKALMESISPIELLKRLPFRSGKDISAKVNVDLLAVPHKNGMRFVSYENLSFISRIGKFSRVYLNNQTSFDSTHSFQHFFQMLNQRTMLRISSDFLVNRSQVASIDPLAGWIELNDGTRLKVDMKVMRKLWN